MGLIVMGKYRSTAQLRILLLAAIVAVPCLFAFGRVHIPYASAQVGPASVDCDVDATQLTMGAQEIQLLNEINDYRAAFSLQPLQPDLILTKIALWKSTQMMNTVAQGGVPAHDDGFRTWQQRFSDCGYTSAFPDASFSENVHIGDETADDTLVAFQHSALHNGNVLNPSFVAVGIKRVTSPDPNDPLRWYWTVTFGSVLDQPLADLPTQLQSGGS